MAQPTILVNMLFGLWPRAKFFTIVSKSNESPGMLFGNPAEVRNRLFRGLKGNHIP